MNKPGSRISVISAIKFWSSSPPSWYSRSSVLCGRKSKLLIRVLTFSKFPWNKEVCLCIKNADCPPSLVLQIRHFRWLQFVSLDAWSKFIYISVLLGLETWECWIQGRIFWTSAGGAHSPKFPSTPPRKIRNWRAACVYTAYYHILY